MIESLSVEIVLNNTKWLITGIYRPPSTNDSECFEDLCNVTDKITIKYDNFAIIGDINYNVMKPDKCVHLMQFCDIFDVTN